MPSTEVRKFLSTTIRPPRIPCNAHRLKPQVLCIRNAARGKQYRIREKSLPARDFHVQAIALCGYAFQRRTKQDCDAPLLEEVFHPIREFAIHHAHQARSAIKQRYFYSQCMTDSRKFHTDRTTSNDNNVLRHPAAIQDRIRIADPWYVERDICRAKRPRARRDQNRFRAQLALAPIIRGDHDATTLFESG